MTPAEFADKAVGVPWVRWRSDFKGMDCFGCIVLWHAEVLGIDLGAVPQTDIGSGFSDASGWAECPPTEGATCFMAWRDGAPTHCGVLLDAANVLHAEGGPGRPGSVRISRLRAIEQIYGPAHFYRYQRC